MCRETIRKAVVQKFNETKNWDCKTIDEIYDKIEDRKEANEIVNSLKICDPAVGSGHFLVSALNELIAVKNDLRILQDREGKRLKEFHIEVVNDELITTDDDGLIYEYNPKSKESQRVQETLFHEKQTLIENCLFGVDINPNSVKICRLRLWIELLKNAYYKNETELETLPNIDINIKCGNSLISRFAIDADLGQALKKSKWSIDSYRLAVSTYRNAQNKEQKREMERLIADIKSDFRSEIASNDPKLRRLQKTKGELFTLTNQTTLFEKSKKEKEEWNKKIQKFTDEIKKLESDIEEIKNNKIYENAFEWRFEFPEVLNERGDFVGFDVVIGNPPYKLVDLASFSEAERNYYSNYFVVSQYKPDLYHYFLENSYPLIKPNGTLMFILPSTWMTQKFTENLRRFILKFFCIERVVHFDFLVFEEANVYTEIIFLSKSLPNNNHKIYFNRVTAIEQPFNSNELIEYQHNFSQRINFIIDIRSISPIGRFISKIMESNPKLEDIARVSLGCQAYNSSKHTKEQIQNRVFHSDTKLSEEYMEELAGSDVGRYFHQRLKGQWIKYGNWLHDYRSIDWLTGSRILIREVTGKFPYQIQATYLEEKYCNYKTILNVCPRPDYKYSMKLLCGILNSSFISFVFSNISNKIQANSFPRVSVSDLKLLPIKSPKSENEELIANEIISNVDAILTLKKDDVNFNTSIYDKKIDQLVYKLYDLTEQEIQVVVESLN
jgi:hypothetical protein